MKNYHVFIADDALTVAYRNQALLAGLILRPQLTHAGFVSFLPDTVTEEEGRTVVSFRRFEARGWQPEMLRLNLILTERGSTLQIDLAAEANTLGADYYAYTFRPEHSLAVDFRPAAKTGGMLSLDARNPFWMTPAHKATMAELHPITESLSVELSGMHLHILPLVSDQCTARLCPEGAYIDIGQACRSRVCAPLLTLCCSGDPFAAVHDNITAAMDSGAIHVLPRSARAFPSQLEGLGWCTWYAYYHDVTADKIYEKLEEFRQKGIRIKWLLIDDGWSQYTTKESDPEHPSELLSFREDRSKFPEGLAGAIRRIKEEYGVRYVGVWHAFLGYWRGVSRRGEIYREHRDCLYEPMTGWCLPGETPEKAFAFWDSWHSYLAAQGVDFVKVDDQNAYATKVTPDMPTGYGVRIQMEALERSVEKNFGGAIINCMGEDMESILNRPASALNRNSDDYFPNRHDGFRYHIVQNAYDAILHGEIHICDYDMFWSVHESAEVSALLRAISGGPVYVSDENGKSDAACLRLLADEEGNVARFDRAARPTYDCFYRDCVAAALPLKLWNQKGDNFVVGAFGVTEGKTSRGELRLADIPGVSGAYIAHEFFSDTYLRVDADTVIPLSVEHNRALLYSFYPIRDGKVSLGAPRRFGEAAEPAARTVAVEELI